MKEFFALAIVIFAASWVHAITIETVLIGDAGNANDPATGNLYGGVSYAYNIGKYEVTVGQYTAFLNAVASTDTFGLYSPSMASDLNIAGIARSGASGGYSYSAIGSSNHPVSYIDWGDAARFVNWLHNGQPAGAEGPGTTETGAYTLNGAATLSNVTRNVDATWFIPTENEWYKAAYFQPAAQGGDSDSYWAYPMRTNSAPFSDLPPGTTPDNARLGNFYSDDTLANGYNDGYAVTGSTVISSTQNYLTDVGTYSSSVSYYGTFDQGGNIYEWIETPHTGGFRKLRGGYWGTDPAGNLMASSWTFGTPSLGFNSRGFRVASIPGIAGDYNDNGTVDAGDYVVWLKNYNTDHTLPNDLIGGIIKDQQYTQWRSNFGTPPGSGVNVSGIPEPSTIVLALAAIAAFTTCCRKSVPHNRV